MTEADDSHSSTRPISVAELLAKNGNIGSPPVGGRRRRRRGNTDSVTVAELTGELPIISDSSSSAEPEAETGEEPPHAAVNGGYAHARPHGRRQTEAVEAEAPVDVAEEFYGISAPESAPEPVLTEAEAE